MNYFTLYCYLNTYRGFICLFLDIKMCILIYFIRFELFNYNLYCQLSGPPQALLKGIYILFLFIYMIYCIISNKEIKKGGEGRNLSIN